MQTPQTPSIDQTRRARMTKRLKARRRAETIFRSTALAAVSLTVGFLIWLIASLIGTGHTAFYQHYVTLDVTLDPAALGLPDTPDAATLRAADYRISVHGALQARFPEVPAGAAHAELARLLSGAGAAQRIREAVLADPQLIGQNISLSLPASATTDQFLKGHISRTLPEARRKLSDQQIGWIDALSEDGAVAVRFNWAFFLAPDSPNAELAGIGGAALGSLIAILIAFVTAVPIGMGAGIYLEEFAPKNRFMDIVEININNLAAVPSIIYGLLGLAFLLNFAGLPRSVPLVAGLVLAVMSLPTIIIATRGALRSISPLMLDGALSLGASHTQAVFHHKVPQAAPSMLTGTIIAMAQALGETAPLLVIGMVAFVTGTPSSATDAASSLPVQIFLWSDSADPAWAARTAAAVLVLLAIMIALNGLAIYLRHRLDRRW